MLKRVLFVLSLAVCMVLSMASPTFAGDLHGTITWQYNNFVGTRGDNGAKIWLWPVNYDKSQISVKDEQSFMLGTKTPQNCFFTKADGFGRYEIYGIPAGEYILFIKSANTTRDLTISTDIVKQHLGRYFHDFDAFDVWCMSTNKYTYGKLKIVDSHPNVVNYDFGNTHF